MRKAFTIDVPHPCTESWEGMEARSEGRFCNACQKTVYDFTQFTDEEFIAFFQQRQEVSCGRFKKQQLSIVITLKRNALFSFGKFPPLAAVTIIAAGLSISAPAQSVKKEIPTHTVFGDTLIRKKPVDLSLLHGRVLDDHGEAVIGATIILKGTTTGTVTDADGSFELSAAEFRNYNVEVRYAGMVSQELAMKPGVPVTVTMLTDETDIIEITTYGGFRPKEERTIRKQ